MIKTTSHIINKQVFEFTYSKTEEAFAMQQQVDSGMQFKINKTLSICLDEFSNDEAVLQIDKLEIDLGEIPIDQLDLLLPTRFYTHFKEKLATVISRKKNLPGESSGQERGPIHKLEIFLLTGNLPWWAGRQGDFSLSETIRFLLEKKSGELRSLLYRHIRNEQFTDRLFYQTDPAQYEECTRLLEINTEQIDAVERSLQKLQLAGFQAASEAERKKNITRLLLKLLAGNNEPVSPAQVSLFMDEKYNLETTEQTAGKEKLAEEKLNAETFKLENSMQKILEKKINEVWLCQTENSADRLGLDLPVSREIISVVSAVQNEITIASNATNGEEDMFKSILFLQETGEKSPVQNAGLVLIAPYLPSLFKELAWISEKGFVHKSTQHKALFMLHYLCTGQSGTPEYTLQLNKILCGMKQEEPVPFVVELSDEEKKEGDQVLRDILVHWTALKSDSVEGLQASFLLREGLLSYNHDRWLLQVEKKGYDILLEQMPWAWQTIKLDWMDQYINTEW